MKKYELSHFKSLWVALYAMALILPPPLHYKGRLFFASEYMLLPAFFFLALEIFKGHVTAPPKRLLAVWAACVLSFFVGLFRRDYAVQISIYDLGPYKFFSFKDDGIVFLRMLILFSTPWIVVNILRDAKEKYFQTFLFFLKLSVAISAVLAILDFQPIHIIDLEKWGYYDSSLGYWSYRAHGTFLTPIESSFIYGAMVVFLLTGYELKKLLEPLNGITLILSLVAVVLSHGGTALVSLVFCCGLFFLREKSEKRILLASVLGVMALLGFIVFPKVFFLQKIGDFIYRQKTYVRYAGVARDHPWILLLGVGFARVCSDNNFITVLIQGGVVLFATLGRWLWSLVQNVPKELRYIFLFWVITWLSFDSLGYWGIGRLCFFFLGF